MFEQFIMHKLLLCHPYNYSQALSRQERTLTPSDLRRALDYLHANLTAPIRVADIAEACCIAGRTPFQYFRDYRGTSPMRYLRAARFEKVRDILAQARSVKAWPNSRNGAVSRISAGSRVNIAVASVRALRRPFVDARGARLSEAQGLRAGAVSPPGEGATPISFILLPWVFCNFFP